MQQVPEEIESVIVGIEAYWSIKRYNSDTGLSFFEDDDESGSDVVEKDFLEDLWGRIQVLSGNGWKVDSDNCSSDHISINDEIGRKIWPP
ncbi:hypothetical protein POTOM_005526 [Populus tomentosa]|uniref:Uncharacterized protein n=1 Tax=Populus tomentosa TaxID=118781 RepID=A0A8X8AHG0_POPTO|nr:hypothetical protein POTOM_005526 [Populus tomentosa]